MMNEARDSKGQLSRPSSLSESVERFIPPPEADGGDPPAASVADGLPASEEQREASARAGRDLVALSREIRALVRDLALVIVLAILMVAFVIQPVRVEGTSMVPYLHDGERILVNKFVYKFEPIRRGDVVVFWYPNDPSKSFIKRVIGLPGETIAIRRGIVYINGEPLVEPYLDRALHMREENMAPIYVREHYYFVMGDNRDSSNDSRQWGLVPEKYIYGKAVFRYWPLGQMGRLP